MQRTATLERGHCALHCLGDRVASQELRVAYTFVELGLVSSVLFRADALTSSDCPWLAGLEALHRTCEDLGKLLIAETEITTTI